MPMTVTKEMPPANARVGDQISTDGPEVLTVKSEVSSGPKFVTLLVENSLDAGNEFPRRFPREELITVARQVPTPEEVEQERDAYRTTSRALACQRAFDNETKAKAKFLRSVEFLGPRSADTVAGDLGTYARAAQEAERWREVLGVLREIPAINDAVDFVANETTRQLAWTLPGSSSHAYNSVNLSRHEGDISFLHSVQRGW